MKKNDNETIDNKNKKYTVIIENVKNRIRKAGLRNKKRIDAKCREFKKFKIGDKVLLKSNNVSVKIDKQIAKFLRIYEGPYVIGKVYGDTTYLLIDDRRNERGKFHVTHLKEFKV